MSSALIGLVLGALAVGPVSAAGLCIGFGPQTPRDIALANGSNAVTIPRAPEANEMNLCDIHTHTNAEHKGPGFSLSGGSGEHGGWKCNDTDALTEAELAAPDGEGGFHGVKPGDTIEVHWVYTTCSVKPGPSLSSCFSDACANPSLRVESQVFLVVNDDSAPDFGDFAYDGNIVGGLHQPKSLPDGTGAPVVFPGSTTGPSYTQAICSPMQVTWSVRPECMKVSYSSIQHWGTKGNVFQEDHSHGVRQLVTAQELLAPIK
ncbi:MAG: cadmium carbonic anhydrase [Rhodobacteraceae bacterium]|nr:cadmium carbonic anhydrase [Paracoccaceae bacterium]